MGIRYSYDDFTTKGHGVIEGPGGAHDDNKEALYTFYKKIPKGYEKISTIDDISVITKRYAYVSKQIMKQINEELERRYVLRFRSGEYIKRNDAGKIEVFKQAKLVKNGKSKPIGTHKEKTVAAYNHLLNIHKKANPK
jgi:hypothetical protein